MYGEGDTQASGTKWRILSAAEEVMSEKGLARSSISEIARKAGVADSVIYQYFKGKTGPALLCARRADEGGVGPAG